MFSSLSSTAFSLSDPSEFLAFFARDDKDIKDSDGSDSEKAVELSEENIARLFKHLLEDHATSITKPIFSQTMRTYYKVLKECPMADDAKVTGSNSLREVTVDE